MKPELKAKIVEVDGAYTYYDKEGNKLNDADIVVYDNGRERKLYLTDSGQLGTDSTNPLWIETGKACEGEYGIYPLNATDMQEITLKKEKTALEIR